jgi:Zn-dependent peptidase ImmA (M78 family)
MKLNAGERGKNEPICISAIKSRLQWIDYKLLEDSLTSEDFEIICEAENIIVVREPRKWDGAYFRRKNRDIIYVKSSLVGSSKTFVEFHELAHYWLHDPEISLIQFFQQSSLLVSKAEREASIVSACAIIPTCYIESFSRNELLDMFRSLDLIEFRFQIYREYGI